MPDDLGNYRRALPGVIFKPDIEYLSDNPVTVPKPTFLWILDAAFGFCISLGLLIAIGTISYRENLALVRNGEQLSRSQQSLEQIRTIFSLLSESEHARRVDMHGDAKQSQIIAGMGIEVFHHAQRLSQLVQDDPNQRRRMDTLLLLFQQEAQAMPRSPAAGGTRGAVARSQEREQMEDRVDQERGLLAAMASDVNKFSQAQQDHAQVLATRAGNIVLVLVVFTFIFLTLAYRGVVKDIRLRQHAEAALCNVQDQLETSLAKERALSRVDPLTGLANRRAFYEILENEKQRCLRYQRPFSLAYIDLDNFKHVNDSRGHHVGDFVLTSVAELIRSHVRASDTVARLGGDEFAILLPETDPNGVKQVLTKLHERLRSELQNAGLDISLSVGAATFLRPPESVDDIVRTADELMYSVKAHGKNDLRLAIMG